MLCNKCGKETGTNAKFCNYCGANLNNTPQTTNYNVNNNTNSEKIYEKWWFWTIIVSPFILAGIILTFIPEIDNNSTSVSGNTTNTVAKEKLKRVLVIDFSSMTREEILEWCNENNLKCEFKEEYSHIIKKGELIDQRARKDEIIYEGDTITLIYSLGEEPALKVDYKKLYEEYMDNPILADTKYKEKRLQLTGNIYNISREIAGEPYITFQIDEPYSLKSIRMTFRASEEENVAELKKGQKVTISGECSGILLGTTVTLKYCEIVK